MTDEDHLESELRKKIAATETALEGATFASGLRRSLLPDLIKLGELLQQDDRHAEAAEQYAKGLTHCDTLLHHKQLDESAFELHIELLGRSASTMLSQGRNLDAIPIYRRAITLIESLGKDAREDVGIAEVLGACHGQLAIALDDSGESDNSFGHYMLSLTCAKSIHADDPEAPHGISILALAHNAIGHHCSEAEQLHDALDHHQRSLTLNLSLSQGESNNPYIQYCLATDHENMCDVLLRQDERTQAKEHAHAALIIRKKIARGTDIPDMWTTQLIDSYRDVAELCTDDADHSGAIQHYINALEVARTHWRAKMEDPERSFKVADCLLALGTTHEACNEPNYALEFYRLALETDLDLSSRFPKESRWPVNAAHCHLCSAMLLLTLGEHEQAAQHVQAGHDTLTMEIASHPELPALSSDLSRFHSDYASGLAAKDKRDEALEHYRLSMEIDRSIVVDRPTDQSALSNLAITLDHIASIHEGFGEFAIALDHNRQTLQVEEQLAQCDLESTVYQGRLVQALVNIASTLREMKDLPAAQQTLRRAEKIARRILRLTPKEENALALVAQVHRELGRTLRESGDHGHAAEEFHESVQRFSSLVQDSRHPESWLANHAQSLEALAELHMDLGRASDALRPLAQALANWQRIARRYPTEATVHRDLAHSHELAAEAHEAISDLGPAMEHRRAAARLYERFGEGHS